LKRSVEYRKDRQNIAVTDEFKNCVVTREQVFKSPGAARASVDFCVRLFFSDLVIITQKFALR